MPTLEVRDLSRWYGEVVGLSGADFSLEPGVTGLLGPNGAGKSTLLTTLTGQIRPNRGDVRILGQPCWGNARLFEHVGYVPESDATYPEMNVLEFLQGFLRLCQVRGAEATRRILEVLEIVGLDPQIRKPMGAFSKGMRQRAKFAQALLMNPEVLLLDEPLNGLDPLVRAETIALFRRYADEGRHVIVSSHVLHEVDMISDQVVLMSGGYVVAEGQIQNVRSEIKQERPMQVLIRCNQPGLLASKAFERRNEGVSYRGSPSGAK